MESVALVKAEPDAPAPLARVENAELSVEQIVARVSKVHEIQREVMKKGHHYGIIPGVDKPSLLKPGAELLGMVFRLDPQFEVAEQLREGQHLRVTVRCTLYHIPSGARVGSGMGSCSTYESKYAYRKGQRLCPKCGSAAIIKGKEEYGGGWLCWKKNGGCDAKFKDGDKAIEGQQVGRVPNEDLADQHNTVLKMAIKRAHVAAILYATCASDIFTQDVEDMPAENFEPPKAPAKRNGKPPAKAAQKSELYQEMMDLMERCSSIAELEKLVPDLRACVTAVSEEEYADLRSFYARCTSTLDMQRQAGAEG